MGASSNSEFMTHTTDTKKIEEEDMDLDESSSPSLNPEEIMDYTHFLKELESKTDLEAKLRHIIAYMRLSLEHKEGPYFREFWESRKLCLDLFKEEMPRALKNLLWKDFIDLTREGRRLKSLLDEETAFAVEQIDLAIAVLESEVQKWHDDPKELFSEDFEITLPETETLRKHEQEYIETQQKLNLLNTFAVKVHAMRKELIKQDIRIRQKNQFFDRLSAIGDKIFPARREMIVHQSKRFIDAVAGFTEEFFSAENFSVEQARRLVFFLRKEIKDLQAVAKLLTLNTYAFTTTREQLSNCWDKLKGIEKEIKKEVAALKVKSQENVKLVQEQLAAFIQKVQENPPLPEEGLRQLDEIVFFMKEVELVREDVYKLKEDIRAQRIPFEEKIEEEAQKHKKKGEEQERQRKEQIENFKQKMQQLQTMIGHEELPTIRNLWEELRSELLVLKMSKIEKQSFERKLKMVRDLISEKEEKALLALSGEDREAFDSLTQLLQERLTRRAEIKAHVEELRKMVGGSGLDFEKAMTLSSQLTEEKERLEKIDEAISEIELKIRKLKRGG